MKRFVWAWLLITLLIVLGAATTLVSPASAADAAPKITSFTTPVTVADRAGLANRTARIPVEWTTANRPITANLIFEQELPDGGVVNVELPRFIPWVSSSGKGIAAAILPSSDATSIILRVRLVNLLGGQTLDERRLTLPIGASDGQASSAGGRAAITRFVTSQVNVRSEALQNRSARVPVSWSAANRAPTANLIFEQVMPDGTARNVELPRDNPWVASSGDGVAAPYAPGNNATQITLRLRLVDLLTGRVYDQRSLTLQIDSAPAPAPSIRYFTTNADGVDATALAQRTARVPVSWAVDNRPDGTNLVFEQIMPNLSAANVELPRSNPWVASSGNGTAAPILPMSGNLVVLRLKLINLTTQATLDSRDLTLPVRGQIGATPPPNGPEVVTLTSDKTAVRSGDTIHVTWDVRGATTVSLSLSASGPNAVDAHIESLAPRGTTTFSIPPIQWQVRRAVINLNVYTTGSTTPAIVMPLALSLACDTHFYSDSSRDCVTSEPTQRSAAYESFERGFMVWRGDTRTVWALYNTGSGARGTETWGGGDITFGEPTPDGRTLPQRGFGQMWTSIEPIRLTLGWGLGPEQGYTATFQTATAADTGASVDYLTTPDGRTYRFQDFGWSLVQ